MKTFFALLVIAVLFAVGSLDWSSSPHDAGPSIDTTTVVVPSFIGLDACLNFHIGQTFDPDKHEVRALWPNYQERNDREQKPIKFKRATNMETQIVDIIIGPKHAKTTDTDIVSSWQTTPRQSTKSFLQDLTKTIISTNENIVAVKYKVIPIDADTFTLEDAILVFRKGCSLGPVEIAFMSSEMNANVIRLAFNKVSV